VIFVAIMLITLPLGGLKKVLLYSKSISVVAIIDPLGM
jgi:hypothetical protein